MIADAATLRAIRAALAAIALSPIAAIAQPGADRPDPVVRADAPEPVSAHVYVILDQGVPFVPNVGFVVGEDAVLVIDTGLGDRNGRTVLAHTEALAPGRDIYIASTHFHPEHDLGATAFPDGAVMVRSRAQLEEVEERGAETMAMFSRMTPVMGELLQDASHRPADIVFDEEHVLDLGGVEARLLAVGPNHTAGDTAVFVEADAVLLAGDVAMSRKPMFATPDSSVAAWLGSLDRLEALEPQVIVPAHGPLGEGSGFIGAYRAYLSEVRDRTEAAKQAGLSVDDAVKTVTADMQSDDVPVFLLTGAVRAAYAEADG